MRRKAENQIRKAAAEIDEGPYRLDAVRAGAGLHPKIFDKTIIDMERVGAIALEPLKEGEDTDTAGLVRHGDRIYARFTFIDKPPIAATQPEVPGAAPRQRPDPADAVVVILGNLLPGEWAEFSDRCQARDGKGPHEKIEEMIRRYLYTGS
jgi:hypothetical protein